MKKKNKVFIATSLDGYIAGEQGEIDWLDAIPNSENLDMGYYDFTKDIDALVMGKNTFETVLSFDVDWPYKKPVFVLSNSLDQIPDSHRDKAFLLKGEIPSILKQIHAKGYYQLYIDGGITIQRFLAQDLIDELVITIIPILLGSGIPLFGEVSKRLLFECYESKVFLGKIVQNHFRKSVRN